MVECIVAVLYKDSIYCTGTDGYRAVTAATEAARRMVRALLAAVVPPAWFPRRPIDLTKKGGSLTGEDWLLQIWCYSYLADGLLPPATQQIVAALREALTLVYCEALNWKGIDVACQSALVFGQLLETHGVSRLLSNSTHMFVVHLRELHTRYGMIRRVSQLWVERCALATLGLK
jgi:hypothetical protein